MALSLNDFSAEVRTKIDEFERAYSAKSLENPEMYPTLIEDGNEGLWVEFFFDFMTNGNV